MATYVRDPVCGMPVDPAVSVSIEHEGVHVFFCSELCKDTFLHSPDRAMTGHRGGPGGEGVRRIAYFSMEIALHPGMPTYSGGLGVLAGDTLRSCADIRLPVVAVTLVHRKGYFKQTIAADGQQHEAPASWSPEVLLRRLPRTVDVQLDGRQVHVGAWRYDVVGWAGYIVPVILLDTDVDGNADQDRRITDWLYGGDERYRLSQEVVLGVGGIRLLRALGYHEIEKIHLNEGHASFAALEMLRESHSRATWDFQGIQASCVFTTHTPVAAGHDRFDYALAESILRDYVPGDILRMLAGPDCLNMTRLALNLSGHVNGVARRHRQVSREMFPGYEIGSVTNGVHSTFWTCKSFQQLFDKYAPGWREDPAMLRQAASIPSHELMECHLVAKRRLLNAIRDRAGREWSTDALTIGCARRATQYKRGDLILSNPERLRSLARIGRLQIVFAGKAHPKDSGGKQLIKHIVDTGRQLGDEVPVVYLQDYDLDLAAMMIAGCDLWLNTPKPPLEASGTSGMKAAHNGVPSLSVLDGWWIEGHVEGVTGWCIGSPGAPGGRSDVEDAEDVYAKLATALEVFHTDPERWTFMMRMAIALNASHFNTHRMVHQYASSAYVA